jgi:ComF family protein
MRPWLNTLLNTLLPSRCPLTGEIVDAPGLLSPNAILKLDFIASPHCACCGVPFRFVYGDDSGHEEMECASCIAQRPIFHQARASLVYDDHSRKMILAFKHGDHLHMEKSLVPLLQRASAQMIEQVDFIIPVPLHWTRMIKRRYNQSALLASGLARAVAKPALLDGLLRTRHTESQGHKNVKERHKNVHNAFAVQNKYKADLKGKNILLVDDVFTTGATVNECAAVLYAAGVLRVDVVTVARVVKSFDAI